MWKLTFCGKLPAAWAIDAARKTAPPGEPAIVTLHRALDIERSRYIPEYTATGITCARRREAHKTR